MEQNLVGVGNILGNLKNMANDMGAEIQRQNEHLDRIDLKACKIFNFTSAVLHIYLSVLFFSRAMPIQE